MVPVLLSIWLDAQHQYVDTAQRQPLRPAQHVVIAVATAMAVVPVAATARPTPRRAAAVAVVVAGPPAEHDRAGREPVRPSRIRQPKYSH